MTGNFNKNKKTKPDMKQKTISQFIKCAALLALGIMVTANFVPPALASGGSGGGGGGSASTVDTIKVAKCEYAVVTGYVELLVSASSSNSSAHLYAYLPDGSYLGEVQNGGGGRYGGTVFLSMYVPATITIKSSAGGSITVATTPYQP
jgi:hypothetical protein